MNNVFALTSPDELQTRADHGEAESQYRFAKKIFNQDGTNIDRTVAAKYFKMAADQNHPKGQNGYGACLEFGIGVSIDMKEAIRYYALAASQGDPIGQMNYGICLLNGYGIKGFSKRVEELMPKMKNDKDELSDIDSLDILKKSYEYVPTDIDEYGNRADFNNNTNSSKCLYPMPTSDAFFAKSESTSNTIMASFDPISSSSSTQNRHIISLANCNSKDSTDPIKIAIKNISLIPKPSDFFKYGAESGDGDAMSAYGRCLLRGETCIQDFKEAERYLQVAADKGDTDAKRCFTYYSAITDKNSPGNISRLSRINNRSYRARSVLHSVTKK